MDEGVLTLSETILKLSVNPAKILKIGKGSLSIGSDADITIIDHSEEWVVDSSCFKSKSKNTPFNGWKLKGKAIQTIVGGRL